ncbi:hypothetical protein [Parabacteroides sp. Marseille-P3160]|uniref:hypothetical protein n=1 Tax=Parabacteroides sp. Marseille-P3160 TaxID=1917887 RepID=UPI0009BBEBD2|nr:hypothetical protein [Parabacteroides sp. Marseille-P3160]
MKRKKYSLVLFACLGLLLINSCGNGEYEGKMVANQIGVVVDDLASGKQLMELYGYGTIYDPRFDTELRKDSCYLINFNIDTLSSENSPASVDANGYKTVRMLDVIPIDRGVIRELPASDTALVYENEQLIANPIGASYAYHDRGRLILFTSYRKYPEQASNWILSYDPENRMSDTNGKSLYTLYLRSTIEWLQKDPNDSTRTLTAVSPNAFDIKSFMDQIETDEAAKGRSEFYFNIRYLSAAKVENDTLRLTWSTTDSLLFRVK